jgi:hypothetical protein
VPAKEEIGHFSRGMASKNAAIKIDQAFHRKIFPASPSSLTLLGKLFSFPVQVNIDDFSIHGRRRGTVSVIAVSRADRSFVVFREGSR